MSIDRSLGRKFYRDIGLPYRHPVVQYAIDVIAIVFGAIFIISVGCSLPLAIFLLLFCQFE